MSKKDFRVYFCRFGTK